MKSSKVHRYYFSQFRCHMSSLTRALLGICVFLFEIRQSQEMSGLGWSAYTILVTTAAATSPTTATTTIITPETPQKGGVPQFHSPQLKLTIRKGDLLLLPCKIHNLGDNHVIWRHGTNVLAGTNVTTYGDERIRLLPDLTLQIAGVSYTDEGEYECILSSAIQRPGLVHSVTVQDAPSVRLVTSSQIVVTEGENAEIGCIPEGKPLPRISWSVRDGQIPIPKSMLHLHRITLERVSRKHGGLYVCHADNGVGRPAMGAVYVRVLYTPEIDAPKRRIHGGVGYKAVITCVIHADPKAEVVWRIGSARVQLSERVYLDTEVTNNEYNLIFNPVKEYDFKTYTCEANNSRGFNKRHIEFTGVPNPPVINRWETQILVKGMVAQREKTQIQEEINVKLFWYVECYSPLIDYKLHFRADRRTDISSFNDENNRTPWTELTIPADQSTSTFIHSKTFPLSGLQPSTIYEAAIKARNKYGWSPMSEVFYFSTFPNSTSVGQQEFGGSLQKWWQSFQQDGKNPDLSKEEKAGFKSGEMGARVICANNYQICQTCYHALLLSLIPVICKFYFSQA